VPGRLCKHQFVPRFFSRLSTSCGQSPWCAGAAAGSHKPLWTTPPLHLPLRSASLASSLVLKKDADRRKRHDLATPRINNGRGPRGRRRYVDRAGSVHRSSALAPQRPAPPVVVLIRRPDLSLLIFTGALCIRVSSHTHTAGRNGVDVISTAISRRR